MATSINYFRNPEPFRRVKIGGRQIKAALKSIGGHKLEADWNVQRSTDSNRAIAAFRGIKLLEGVALVFACGDGDGSSSAEDFDDLRELFSMMLPKIVNGKPPTLSIENAVLALIGLTSINLKSWQEGPTDTGGWEAEVTVIQSSPPTPAKTGAQDPSKPGGGAASSVDPQIAALQKVRDKLAAEAAGV